MQTNFQNAVNNKVVGLGNNLTQTQQLEYKNIDEVINRLKEVKKLHLAPYYIELLPLDYVKSILVGKIFKNKAYWTCQINSVWRKGYDLIIKVTSSKKSEPWEMYFKTIMKDCKFQNIAQNIRDKYLVRVNANNIDNYIAELENKKRQYDTKYRQTISNANRVINQEVSKHPNEMVVSREAIRQSIRSIQKDSKVIADAWNSTLTQAEQNTLINWLSKNIYSMRLYVVQGSSWDKAISELYPEEIYGKPRRTISSEKSKDSINGYISVNSIDGNVPYDILKKITHKQNNEDVIKYYGKNTYRINNYLLVLYLLNNYNKNGFKLGKTNLYKDITL